MAKKGINAWRQRQKSHDKHRKYQNSQRGQNTHALIISHSGLYFRNGRGSFGFMKNFKFRMMVVSCLAVCFLSSISYKVHRAFAESMDDVKDSLPELYIKAINPGYTVDGVGNVGEMIEIGKNSADEMISLAGATVGYTNSSGNYSIIFEFPENSWITGESILLRLASSPESELASINYSKTLAFKGGLDLRINDDVVDEVCWTSKTGCYKEFKSSSPTTLVRDEETGEFEHLFEYEPVFDEESYYVEILQEEEGFGRIASQCKGLEFSEVLSFYETSKSEQFIELHNASAEQIPLDGCKLKYKNKYYSLHGVVGPDLYYVYVPEEFSLTKNPVNENLIELIDVDGETIDELRYPNGQKKGTAYALIGYDDKGEKIWKVTYAPTPGEANNYQEFKSCEEGKVINAATGNCVKVASTKKKVCASGQYLNILTGRCKKIVTSTEKVCKKGYYLNPATGRCKKIVENKGADYGIKPETYEENSSFIALYAVLGVAIAGLLYVFYEYRREIWRWIKRMLTPFCRASR